MSPHVDLRRALAVYPIVDLGMPLPRAATHEERVAALLSGGATMIQLRDKREEATRLVELARRVKPWCREAGVPLVVNDRVELAIAGGADGLHVGQRDMAVEVARAVARARGRDALFVGVSVRTLEEASRALSGGARYLSVSPVFDTPTKADAERGVGLAGVRALRVAHPDAPLVAIGGIDLGRARAVVAAGADGVAFISAIARDPEPRARAFADAVREGRRAATADAGEVAHG